MLLQPKSTLSPHYPDISISVPPTITFTMNLILMEIVWSNTGCPKTAHQIPTGRKAVCEAKPDVNTTEIYVYDIATEQTDFWVKRNIERWGVSGDGDFLLYIIPGPNVNTLSVYIYNFATKTQHEVGIVDVNKEINFPFFTLVSSDFLVGINYEREEWMIAEMLPDAEEAL